MKNLYLLSIGLFLLPLSLTCQHMSRVAMDDFFGVNITGISNTAEDIDDIANWVRHYTRWSYYEAEEDNYEFTNAITKEGRYNHDKYFQDLQKHDVKTLQVIMRSTDWASSNPEAEHPQQWAPSRDNDGLDPSHYKDVAEFYYQHVARYGSKKHSADQLQTNDKISGLNLLDVIEVENEPDGPWNNHMNIEQYANLLNAVYDGNQGKLGEGYGIKAADPDMPVSMGGVAYNIHALNDLVKHAGRVPFDIINVHFYCFKFVRENYRVAIPPEWSSLEMDMKEIAEWRDKEAPGRPIWLTEIGWDTKHYKTEGVTEQEASNYLIRSYLLALSGGVEKVFWFIMRDLDDWEHPTTFSSSGLFENNKVDWSGPTRLKPKMTYWYNATFKNLTDGYYYHRKVEAPKGDKSVYRYEFFNEDKSEKLIIAWTCPEFQYRWHPDPEPTTKEDYLLPTEEGWKVSKVVRPVDGSDQGETPEHEVSDKGVTLELTGTPVFVELEKTK